MKNKEFSIKLGSINKNNERHKYINEQSIGISMLWIKSIIQYGEQFISNFEYCN